MKVLICDPVAPETIESLVEAGIEVDNRPDISAEELLQVAADYDGMVVRSRTKIRQDTIDAATNLKIIVRGGVGLDNIDVAYAQSKGISVRNTPKASSDSVAELVIGFLLALARRIPQATASMAAGEWQKKKLKGTEIAVLFYRRTSVEVPYAQQVSLDELLAQSDYISLHVPHTPETHYILGAEAFARMKDGVRIVNCGRGGTLDEEALYQALQSGKVAGAALDVFEDEKARWLARRWMSLRTKRSSPATPSSLNCGMRTALGWSSARPTSGPAPSRARPGSVSVGR